VWAFPVGGTKRPFGLFSASRARTRFLRTIPMLDDLAVGDTEGVKAIVVIRLGGISRILGLMVEHEDHDVALRYFERRWRSESPLIESDIGLVPKNWRVDRLVEFAHFQRGYDITKKQGR
jgi:hypothetical protein